MMDSFGDRSAVFNRVSTFKILWFTDQCNQLKGHEKNWRIDLDYNTDFGVVCFIVNKNRGAYEDMLTKMNWILT